MGWDGSGSGEQSVVGGGVVGMQGFVALCAIGGGVVGWHTEVVAYESKRKPLSYCFWILDSVRHSGAHSTMYWVRPYSESLWLERMRVTLKGG
jgi:hypothetical protein